MRLDRTLLGVIGLGVSEAVPTTDVQRSRRRHGARPSSGHRSTSLRTTRFSRTSPNRAAR